MTKKTVANLKAEFNANIADNTTGDITPEEIRNAFINTIDSALVPENNLSDVDNASTSRTNLGLEIGSDVQAYSTILQNTTASFTTADETKLDGIEDNATADQTDEEIQDAAWDVLGGTQTLITVTYQDGTNDVDFIVDNDLSNYDNSTSAFITASSSDTLTNKSGNISQWTNDVGYITATLTDEQVQDIVGGMVSGNTETLITVTYQDGDGTIDFVVDNDLSNYDNSSAGFITDSDNVTWTGDHIFSGLIDVNNVNAQGSGGGTLRNQGGTNCASWGGGGGQNFSITNTLSFGAGGASVTGVLDEDDMASNSATKLATQQSIKAYVDANGGGAWDVLSQQTAASDTEIDFNGLFTSDYDYYMIICSNVAFSTGTRLVARTSTNGSIYDSGASDYNYALARNSGTLAGTANAASEIRLSGSASTGSGQNVCATIYLYNPLDTSSVTSMNYISSTNYSAGVEFVTGSAIRASADDVVGVRLFPESGGNFPTGEFLLIGVKNA